MIKERWRMSFTIKRICSGKIVKMPFSFTHCTATRRATLNRLMMITDKTDEIEKKQQLCSKSMCHYLREV